MALLNQPTSAAKASLIYITVGALLDVWTGVWYFTYRDPNMPQSTIFWLTGFFLMGVILMVIGFCIGPLGRLARKAELPPSEVINAEAAIQRASAATPDKIVPVTPAQLATPNNATVMPNPRTA